MKKQKRGTIGWLILSICIGLFTLTQTSAASDQIRWQPFKEGMSASKSEGKPLLLHFYSNNCRYCDLMAKETFTNTEIIDLLSRQFIAVKVNIDAEQKLPESFRVRGVPDTWFINNDGKIYGHRPGYINKEMFLKILNMVVKQSQKGA